VTGPVDALAADATGALASLVDAAEAVAVVTERVVVVGGAVVLATVVSRGGATCTAVRS
jgi:hypothetical protein